MKILILSHAFSLCVFIFAWTFLYAQNKNESSNRALRLFFSNQVIWVFLEFLMYFDGAEHLHFAIKKAMAIFWISCSFWMLVFVYKLFSKKTDWFIFINFALIFINIVLFLSTDLGLLGIKKLNNGNIVDIRAPWYIYFTIIPLIQIFFCFVFFIKGIFQTQEIKVKRPLQLLLTGSILSALFIVILDIILPHVYKIEDFANMGPCSPVLLVPFLIIAMFKYNFLSTDISQIANNLFQNSYDGIIVADANNTIQQMNPVAQRIFNVEKQIISQYKLSTLIPNYETLAKNKTDNITIKHKTGETWHLSVSHSVTKSGIQKVGIIIVLHDLTAEKKAIEMLKLSRDEFENEIQKRIAELSKMQELESIGTMSGSISHDFNNLLAAIIGFTTAAIDDLPKNHKIINDLEEVLLASNKAKDVVNQLLTFSRNKPEHRDILNITAVLNSTLSLVESSLPATITLNRNIPDKECLVMGNSTNLNQVVMNLCTNAIQSMENSDGVLTVSLGVVGLMTPMTSSKRPIEPDMTISISISDTGKGIEETIVESIFEPFFSTTIEGSGLGLATAQRIMNEHGGAITVESTINEGSTFTVLLPKIDRDERPEDETTKQTTLTGAERILIVGNDRSLVKVAQKILAALGYKTTTFTKPSEAINAFRKTPAAFDLIVTDYSTDHAQINGIDLAHQMFIERIDIPILLIASNISVADLKRSQSVGIRSFLSKPIVKKELAGKIRRLLDKPKDHVSFPPGIL